MTEGQPKREDLLKRIAELEEENKNLKHREIMCLVESCIYNLDCECKCPFGPTIYDDLLTLAGFLPTCMDYEEKEEVAEDG